MKRLHIHVRVERLDQGIEFYNTLFGQPADVIKDDYAKWMLDDPAVNFAVSTCCGDVGLKHLGLQVDSDDELAQIRQRLEQANIEGMAEDNRKCCYARSNKYWTKDPARIPWENFHTLESLTEFAGSKQEDGRAGQQ